MNKKTSTRLIICLLLLTMLPWVMPGAGSFADVLLLQPPKQNSVTDIGYIRTVYRNEWYATLGWEWNPANFPPEADERYIIVGFNEIAKGTGQVIQDAITVGLSGSSTSYELNEYTPEGLKKGTIYESYVKSQYRSTTPTGQYTVTSQKSNPVRFLTGLDVSVELLPGTNHMKIKWDDVWDTTGRISYRILISDTKGFTQPTPIPDIIASEIGKPGSAVVVNSAERKLEYVYTYALPGREYSIKVVPLPNPNVACASAEEIEAIPIQTDILLRAQKVGYTSEGDTIWRLFWNPIVKGNTFSTVEYKLYRYVNNDPEGYLFSIIPDTYNYYQFIIKKGDTNTYSFRMDATAQVRGTGATVDFRSQNKVTLKEQIPQYPEAPEIVDAFPEADPPVYYDDYLSESGATVFWKAPKTGEGQIDNDITYDVYLVQDIEYVNSTAKPPSNYMIATGLRINPSSPDTVNNPNIQIVKDAKTGIATGYGYRLEGLRSNSTYYFVIYAKKNYLVESPQDGFMVTRAYESKQAVKVIITDPDEGENKPQAPSAPPFKVHEVDGRQVISYTGATLELAKRWHAVYDEDGERWEYIEEPLGPEHPDYKKQQEFRYLTGWLVEPHVINYGEALIELNKQSITYNDLNQIKKLEIPQQKVPIPNIPYDAEDQTFTFDIAGLEDNNTYIVWLTIENQNGVASDPSDPLIITTPAEVDEKPVKPTVPEDLGGIAGDNFVDLFWTHLPDMDYEIRGGKTEKIDQATITKQVTAAEIRNRTFVRIDSLEADTGYYFWIRTISRGSNGQTYESEFSNPFYIKTEAYKPPAPPTGFGIKNGPDGVTENSITYVWTQLDGLTYILELADDPGFRNLTTAEVNGDTHTFTGLISNRRYYARLYAYNPATKLRSEPTRTIMVITNKSRSDYDSSYDLDDPVTGDGLKIPAKLDNGVWVISSVGADGHVLAERIRSLSYPIVKIDLSKPPAKTSTVRIELSSVVIDVLSDLKKELYLVLPWGSYTIRPGTFQTDEYFRMKSGSDRLDLRLETVSPASQYKAGSNMQYKTPVTEFKFSYIQGAGRISRINIPIRVELPVDNIANFVQGQISAYGYDSGKGWYKLQSYNDYNAGMLIGELDRPVAVVGATDGIQPQSGVPSYIKESMQRLQAVYDLKSIENRPFDHNAQITMKDALKLVFDVIGAPYNDSDIAEKAVSAGLIGSTNELTGSSIRRDKAISLLMSFYRFRTREKTILSKPGLWSRYTDLSKAEPRYQNDYKFALEMGIIQGNATDFCYPDRLVTLGDFLVFFERTLRVLGEL